MARTLQDLINRVRVITGDKTAAQFLDVDIARWATDEQLRLIRGIETTETTVNLVSLLGTTAHPVAGGFLWIRDLFYNGVKLARRTTEEMDAIDPYRLQTPLQQGVPQLYWLTQDTINLYPAPDTAGVAIVARIVPRPADLVNPTDSFAIPDDKFETVVRYCLQMAKEWDEDYIGAAYFKQDVKERTAEDAYHHQTAGAESFTVVRDAPGENW